MAARKLDELQRRFAEEYLKDLNATRAAKAAGYTQDDAGAAVQGHRLLRNPKIAALIQSLMDARSKRVEVSADTVLRELLLLAKSDLRKLFDDTGALLPPDKWPDDVAPAISSVEVDELFEGFGQEREQIGLTKKVKFWDKPKALELLGKHLRLFGEDKPEKPRKPLVLKYSVEVEGGEE